MRMGRCRRGLRATLLLGTAFLASLAIGPASGLIARHFAPVFRVNAAYAQDSERTDIMRWVTAVDATDGGKSAIVATSSKKRGLRTGLDARHFSRGRLLTTDLPQVIGERWRIATHVGFFTLLQRAIVVE